MPRKEESELQQWKDFIENARLIARQERHLMDSIVHIKAENDFAKERVCTGKVTN